MTAARDPPGDATRRQISDATEPPEYFVDQNNYLLLATSAIYTPDEFLDRSISVRHPITFTEVRLIRIATQTAVVFPATTLTPEAGIRSSENPMAAFREAEL